MEWEIDKIVPSTYTGRAKGAISKYVSAYIGPFVYMACIVGHFLSAASTRRREFVVFRRQCSVPVEMPLQLHVFRVDTYVKHRPYTKCRSKIRRMYSDASVSDTIEIHEYVKKVSSKKFILHSKRTSQSRVVDVLDEVGARSKIPLRKSLIHFAQQMGAYFMCTNYSKTWLTAVLDGWASHTQQHGYGSSREFCEVAPSCAV